MSSEYSVLWAAIVSFCIATSVIPLLKRLAVAFRMTASPAVDVSGAVPVLGGPAIIAGFMLAALTVHALPMWLALAIVFLCLAGLLDDAIVLTPAQKLGFELIAAIAVLALWPHFSLTGIPPLDAIIAASWLIITANAFNLIDGLDGLAGGVGVVIAGAIAIAALLHGYLALAVQSAALASALVGFLMFNFSPASIFMGDSGALSVGLLLGVLALRAGQSATSSPLAQVVFPPLVMMVPLLNASVVSISRTVTGHRVSRRSLDHAHDRLLMLGLSPRSTVLVSWMAQLAFALCALVLALMPSLYVAMLLPGVVVAAAVAALFMADLTFDAIAPSSAYQGLRGRGIGRLVLRLTYQWRGADILLDAGTITFAYIGAYLIRLDFAITQSQFRYLAGTLWQVLLLSYVAFLIGGVYRNIWRYTSVSDALRFARAAAIAGVLVGSLTIFNHGAISWSITLLFTILLANLLIATRFSFHLLRWGVLRLARSSRRVLIFGAGRTGAAAANDLHSRRGGVLVTVIGFLDDDPFKRGKIIHGSRVLGPLESIEAVYRRMRFDEVIIAATNVADSRLNRLREFSQRNRIILTSFELVSKADPVMQTRLANRIVPEQQRALSPAVGSPV
jgi:UDP-GlcNAc:undecaprenyl-phosphate GlcNAc-1-phosphate transferase